MTCINETPYAVEKARCGSGVTGYRVRRVKTSTYKNTSTLCLFNAEGGWLLHSAAFFATYTRATELSLTRTTRTTALARVDLFIQHCLIHDLAESRSSRQIKKI